MKKPNTPRAGTLWTRDFTIITVGSIVSMLGNSISGFAISLLVLDLTQSTLLYAVYLALYTVPQLIVPIISGAVLDRFSRKRTIYTLDFITAGLYVLLAVLIWSGWFSFALFAVGCFVLGCIESTYMVAYESFYPLLITEGNYQKAYSIASVLETLSAVMVPVSTFLYKHIGIAPLLAASSVCFLLAAVMETRIGAEEKYIETQKETLTEGVKTSKQVMIDIREGFGYLLSEKGLLAIALYFAVSSVCGGVSNVITLPYFRGTFENGEYWYMLVWGMNLVGRGIGGMIHYRIRMPDRFRYAAALIVYIVISLAEGFYLFTPVPAMMACTFLIGIGGVTSYTIRISATQSYVPDEKKGRFNGAFNVLSTAGALLGQLTAGLLSSVLPQRMVLMTSMLFCALAAVVFIGGRKSEVERIYNRSR